MAANTGEDHVDDPAIQQNIQQSAEDSPQSTENENISEELQTTNHQLQTEEMEVHKHPHHVTHKKKWAEYLLEFFMLFLAVFLGFVVENFREHQVEEGRTERHMHTMVENLKYDTTRFGGNLRVNLHFCKGLDSFRYQVREAMDGRVDVNRLYYYYWKYGRAKALATTNAAAMNQLKSSGMLRMIKVDSLVAEMGDYYERMYNQLEFNRVGIDRRLDDVNDIYKRVFSYNDFDEIIERDTILMLGGDLVRERFSASLLNHDPTLKLYHSDNDTFQQLYDAVAAYELSIRSYDARLRYCHQHADSLIKHIKEVYHLENE